MDKAEHAGRAAIAVVVVATALLAVPAALACRAPDAVLLTADLSERRLTLRIHGRAVLKTPVAIGRPHLPTPTGRFWVTAKLDGWLYRGRYGVGVLTLNVRQDRPPANRSALIAIHGLTKPLPRAWTTGCLGVPEKALRRLMRLVPIGARVVIEP